MVILQTIPLILAAIANYFPEVEGISVSCGSLVRDDALNSFPFLLFLILDLIRFVRRTFQMIMTTFATLCANIFFQTRPFFIFVGRIIVASAKAAKDIVLAVILAKNVDDLKDMDVKSSVSGITDVEMPEMPKHSNKKAQRLVEMINGEVMEFMAQKLKLGCEGYLAEFRAACEEWAREAAVHLQRTGEELGEPPLGDLTAAGEDGFKASLLEHAIEFMDNAGDGDMIETVTAVVQSFFNTKVEPKIKHLIETEEKALLSIPGIDKEIADLASKYFGMVIGLVVGSAVDAIIGQAESFLGLADDEEEEEEEEEEKESHSEKHKDEKKGKFSDLKSGFGNAFKIKGKGAKIGPFGGGKK